MCLRQQLSEHMKQIQLLHMQVRWCDLGGKFQLEDEWLLFDDKYLYIVTPQNRDLVFFNPNSHILLYAVFVSCCLLLMMSSCLF